MINACYCVYNEEQLLRSSLDSIYKYVDRVFVLSGKWLDDKQSDDDTNKILKDYNVVNVKYIPNLYESQARNYLYSQVPENEFIFIIDGDEIIIGDMKKAREQILYDNLDWYELECFNNGMPWCLLPRFIRQKNNFHLKDRHWHYYLGDKLVWSGHGTLQVPSKKLDNIKMLNLNSLRSENRVKEQIMFREFMSKSNWFE